MQAICLFRRKATKLRRECLVARWSDDKFLLGVRMLWYFEMVECGANFKVRKNDHWPEVALDWIRNMVVNWWPHHTIKSFDISGSFYVVLSNEEEWNKSWDSDCDWEPIRPGIYDQDTLFSSTTKLALNFLKN